MYIVINKPIEINKKEKTYCDILKAMTTDELVCEWRKKAEDLVASVWCGYMLGINIEQARADQQVLALMISLVREQGIIYNGCYDYFTTLKI